MNNIYILIIALFLFSCSNSSSSNKEDEIIAPKPSNMIDKEKSEKSNIKETKELKDNQSNKLLAKGTDFGEIHVTVSNKDGRLKITSNSDEEVSSISFKGNIDAFIETDVDGDGFNEFYCVSNSGDLVAFSSYRNKSFGQIFISKKPYKIYPESVNVKFWEAKNKKLSITFEDISGKLNTVRYKLEQGEASYQLLID